MIKEYLACSHCGEMDWYNIEHEPACTTCGAAGKVNYDTMPEMDDCAWLEAEDDTCEAYCPACRSAYAEDLDEFYRDNP
jgi:formate dehydrogenase maturation protein FdhE